MHIVSYMVKSYKIWHINKNTNGTPYKCTYFVNDITNAQTFHTEDNIISMLEYSIDNIFVEFGGHIFQQSIGIPMGTNCAPLLVDLFLYSYEAVFIQRLVKSKRHKEAKSFNFTSSIDPKKRDRKHGQRTMGIRLLWSAMFLCIN